MPGFTKNQLLDLQRKAHEAGEEDTVAQCQRAVDGDTLAEFEINHLYFISALGGGVVFNERVDELEAKAKGFGLRPQDHLLGSSIATTILKAELKDTNFKLDRAKLAAQNAQNDVKNLEDRRMALKAALEKLK